MRTIGLTGGIGSGKSAVAQMLAARGAAFVNADLVGHRSYLKGAPTYERLIEAFGRQIVGADGEIDRQKLGRRVFADPEDRHRLNDIVWPAMAEMMAHDLDELRAKGERVAGPVDVLVAPNPHGDTLFRRTVVDGLPRRLRRAEGPEPRPRLAE